ncbi:MAG: phosphatase PAP2 family protein [Chloroflexi bacterium]|nr:phosphatase PAP2 family protein [Chloroflexota bacterium]
MDAIWQWGIDFIHTVQLVQSPVITSFFKAVTFMGEKEFFLLLLPLVFWCVDFAIGIRLALAYLISVYVNVGFKEIIAHPRPFELDPTVQLRDEIGYGIPSGHAQSSVVVWGTMAFRFRKQWLWIVAPLLMLLIGFSRIYLGVHFPTDVLGGWALGAIFLWAFFALEPRVEAWLKETSLTTQLALAVVAPLILLLLNTSSDVIVSMAALMGMGAGLVLSIRWVPFSADGPLWQRVVRFLVGAVGLVVFYYGLKVVFPGEGEPLYVAARIVRYALVGLWTALGAPWLFLRLGLASSE